MSVQGSILGNAVQRREDPTLLRGEELYFDDLDIAGVAHVHFVRSTFAHGTLDEIDISEAEAMPGVIAVHTAETLALEPFLGMPLLPPVFARPPMASGKVRFVGDIVAMVVAETKAQAVDAAEAIWPEVDPLPAVVDPLAGLADDAPVLFEDHGSNAAFQTSIGTEDGDPCEGATTVADCRVVSQRLAGVPIEPNGAIAVPEDDHLTLWVPTQNPNAVKDALVGYFGLDADDVRVVAPSVGGGFGPKAGLYVEFILTVAAARALGRPVKWTEDRSENMVSLAHGRGMIMDARLGLDGDGKMTGLDVHITADAGAYPAIGAFLVAFTQMMIQGVYEIPKIRYQATAVATNTTFTAAYRGAGRPEATQVLERVIDVAADLTGIDPAELRRRNFLQPDAFPLTTLGGMNYDSGEYEASLDAALDAVGYDDLLADQQRRRDAGDSSVLGIGVASYVEVTAPAGMHKEYGAVKVLPDGTVEARVGTSAHGQGHVTAFSMIVSDMLGVPMDSIRIIQSDTAEIPRGTGTMGSRSLQTAGSAVHVASENVLDKARTLAAHLLEASQDDIVKGDGGLHVTGVPANTVTWAELATAADDPGQLPEGMDPGLAHELDFDGTDSTFPFGAHVAVVEVDTETGRTRLLRHVAVDDCGTILNPLLVAGQQHGGIAQGAAQALFEGVEYDEDGNPVTANLADYGIPSAAELPSFEVSNTETASLRNPLGAKGIGESGTIGSTPAIQNAVVDAVSHLGVRHIDMPLTPMRVWEAIQPAQG
ncbi:MAG: xanthine dehydrogenase family protein molybdopterin-binding subunit [Acidimicrobiales bacterium]|nr:xanthine dehydrogenase family protein molybdopterin-binding subunit [Acidimicrobiales bacterium]